MKTFLDGALIFIRNKLFTHARTLTARFPKEKPKIYLKRYCTHKYIDSATLEVIYMSFYQWQENSDLNDLIVKITNVFK